jgi:hypothetical protein
MNPEHKKILEEIDASAEELRRTVEAIPAALLDQRPQPEEWSVIEILVHVRNVVMLVYGMRIRQLLFQDEPVFANYEEEHHLLSASKNQMSAAEILEMIETDHQQTVRLLKALPEQEWQRQGYHPEFGAMSVEFLARRFIQHAADHTQQIAHTRNEIDRIGE